MKIQIHYDDYFNRSPKVNSIELTCTPELLREMADTLDTLPVGKGRIMVDQSQQPKLIVVREGTPSITIG